MMLKSSVACVLLPLFICLVPAVQASENSGITARVDSAFSDFHGVCVEIQWDEGAENTTLSLNAPDGVSILLPSGDTLRAGDHKDLGPVYSGESLMIEIFGMEEGGESLLIAERLSGLESYQSVIDIALDHDRGKLLDTREYLVRPAREDDFNAAEGKINDLQNSAISHTGRNALVIESLSPKLAATIFAEDPSDRAIADGPIGCGDGDHNWQVTEILHVQSAPAGVTSTAITAHVEITHPVMADLQVAFGRSDNAYSFLLNYLLKNDAGVNLDRDFTHDRFNHNFMALGDEVNGYYDLSVRDCTAGHTGTLTYYSVLIEYGAPTTIDLLADTVQVVTDPVAPGDSATVNWSGHVEGTGTVSGAFNTNLYLSTDTNITSGDTWLATINVASATNPGDTFGESAPGHTVTIPGGLSDGTYYIGAIVDVGNTIAESNEGNNTAWDSFQVQTAADEYDLIADSLTPQSGSVQAGNAVAVNWFGHLAGTSSGTLSTSFTVGFYLSTDMSITTGGDTLLTRTTIAGPLAPGASIGTSGLNLTIPGGTSAGSYYIGMIVDDTDAVAETNEGNNVSAAAISVTGGGGGGQPDLVSTGCSLSSSQGEAGDVITVNWQGRNDGTGDAPAFTAGLYLSTDGHYDAGADTQLRTRSLGPWSAGHSEDISLNFTIRESTTAGTWNILVVEDPTNTVAESNENNNSCSATITITSTEPPTETTRWLLPAAASAPGANSSNWKTQIAVSNPTTSSRQATIYYVPDGWAWPGVLLSGPRNIGAHQSLYLDDVLLTMNPTAGLLYVVLDASGPVVTSRTYNLQADGSTYGQGIPAVALDSGTPPTDFILPMVHSGGGRFHTNLGIVQASAGTLTVRLDFYTSTGLLMVSTNRTISDAWEQINDVFSKVGLGATLVEGGWIQVHLNSAPPDAWTAYASVVDDDSGDPTFIAGVPLQ